MSYALTAALRSDRHTLNSSHPWAILAELIPGTGPTERYTNAREAVIFHSLTFTPRPFSLSEMSVSSANEPARLQATCGNANLYMKSLKENYWKGTIYPNWIVTLWHVDTTQPDEVPLGAPITVLRVVKIQMNQEYATLELAPPYVSTTRNLRLLRYLPSNGFPTARTG